MSTKEEKAELLVERIKKQAKKEKTKKKMAAKSKSGRILGGELYNIRQKYEPAEANRILKKYCKNR